MASAALSILKTLAEIYLIQFATWNIVDTILPEWPCCYKEQLICEKMLEELMKSTHWKNWIKCRAASELLIRAGQHTEE